MDRMEEPMRGAAPITGHGPERRIHQRAIHGKRPREEGIRLVNSHSQPAGESVPYLGMDVSSA